jgi:alanyl-tRNA synthetase
VKQISRALSVKPSEVADGVARLQSESEQLRMALATAKREPLAEKLAKIEPTEGNLVLFETDCDANALRYLVNGALPKCDGICAAFCGADDVGYKYIIAANGVDLRALSKEINAALSGRGGGSSQMIQGSCSATKAQIEAYFMK